MKDVLIYQRISLAWPTSLSQLEIFLRTRIRGTIHHYIFAGMIPQPPTPLPKVDPGIQIITINVRSQNWLLLFVSWDHLKKLEGFSFPSYFLAGINFSFWKSVRIQTFNIRHNNFEALLLNIIYLYLSFSAGFSFPQFLWFEHPLIDRLDWFWFLTLRIRGVNTNYLLKDYYFICQQFKCMTMKGQITQQYEHDHVFQLL